MLDSRDAGTIVTFFDADDQQLASFDLNATGGGHGPTANGFNGYTASSAVIARIQVSIVGSDWIWFDDLRWVP